MDRRDPIQCLFNNKKSTLFQRSCCFHTVFYACCLSLWSVCALTECVYSTIRKPMPKPFQAVPLASSFFVCLSRTSVEFVIQAALHILEPGYKLPCARIHAQPKAAHKSLWLVPYRHVFASVQMCRMVLLYVARGVVVGNTLLHPCKLQTNRLAASYISHGLRLAAQRWTDGHFPASR